MEVEKVRELYPRLLNRWLKYFGFQKLLSGEVWSGDHVLCSKLKVLKTGLNLSDWKGLIVAIPSPWTIRKTNVVWGRYRVLSVFPNSKISVIGCPVSRQVQSTIIFQEYSIFLLANRMAPCFILWVIDLMVWMCLWAVGWILREPMDERHVASPKAATCP